MMNSIFKKVTAHNPFAPRQYGTLHAVTDRVYILRNITNSSFVIGDRSVAVIDTQVNRPGAERLLAMVRSVTDKPIEFVINTHYHWDHTQGNAIFKQQGATVISSARTKAFMVERAPRQKEFLRSRGFELGEDPYLPDSTFEGEMHLDLGNMPLRVFFAGSAETVDASAVWIAQEGVLISGDTVMTGSFPIFGQPCWDEGLEGDGAWSKTVQGLMALKPKHIIPGHGPLAYANEIKTLLTIESYFEEAVKSRLDRSMKLDEIITDIEKSLPDWIRKIPLVWGTPRYAILRVYRGLTKASHDKEEGWQRYKPSAIPAAEATRLTGILPAQGGTSDYLALASEAKEGGDSALRLSILKHAIQKFPLDETVRLAYADALIEESRAHDSVLEKGDFFQEARSVWEGLLVQNPESAPALLGLGRFLVMMAYRGGDDPRSGMALVSRAAEKYPSGRPRAEAEFYLGVGYRRLGDEVHAHQQFTKALKLDPSFFPARLALQA